MTISMKPMKQTNPNHTHAYVKRDEQLVKKGRLPVFSFPYQSYREHVTTQHEDMQVWLEVCPQCPATQNVHIQMRFIGKEARV